VVSFESPFLLLVDPFVGHDNVEPIFFVHALLVENADPVFVTVGFLDLFLSFALF
jgi:hypothetical protein